MLNVTLTAQGPSLCVGGVDDGAPVTVSLSGGAVLEMSRNLRDWSVIATQSGAFSAVTPDGKRAVLRFNLPTYAAPVSVSIDVAEGG